MKRKRGERKKGKIGKERRKPFLGKEFHKSHNFCLNRTPAGEKERRKRKRERVREKERKEEEEVLNKHVKVKVMKMDNSLSCPSSIGGCVGSWGIV